MTHASLELVRAAVFWLGLLTLMIALTVFLLMETRYRLHLSREARYVMFASQWRNSPQAESVQGLWSKSSRADQEILEEVLLDGCRVSGPEQRTALETLCALRVPERWLRDLREGPRAVRVRAAVRLGFFPDAKTVQALTAAAEDPSPEVRRAIALSLGRLKDPRGLPALMHLARAPRVTLPDSTLAAAVAACAEKHAGLLTDFLRAPETRARVVVAWALSQVADPGVLPQLVEAAGDHEPEVRAKVAGALARIHRPEAMEALVRLSRDPVWFVRVRALDALGRLGAPESEAALLQGLEDDVREVRHHAAWALRQIRKPGPALVEKVLTITLRRSFDSLISEWDRAGFLWEAVAGLSPGNWPRFLESREILRLLIRAGATAALLYFVLVFPGVKIRLRLVRLLAESPEPNVQGCLEALAGKPGCDPRVAAKIRQICRKGIASGAPPVRP